MPAPVSTAAPVGAFVAWRRRLPLPPNRFTESGGRALNQRRSRRSIAAAAIERERPSGAEANSRQCPALPAPRPLSFAHGSVGHFSPSSRRYPRRIRGRLQVACIDRPRQRRLLSAAVCCYSGECTCRSPLSRRALASTFPIRRPAVAPAGTLLAFDSLDRRRTGCGSSSSSSARCWR